MSNTGSYIRTGERLIPVNIPQAYGLFCPSEELIKFGYRGKEYEFFSKYIVKFKALFKFDTEAIDISEQFTKYVNEHYNCDDILIVSLTGASYSDIGQIVKSSYYLSSSLGISIVLVISSKLDLRYPEVKLVKIEENDLLNPYEWVVSHGVEDRSNPIVFKLR